MSKPAEAFTDLFDPVERHTAKVPLSLRKGRG